MYGLLLENLSEYIKSVYGEEKWEDIRRQAGVDSPSFSVHQVYPENLLNKLAKKAQQVLGVSEHEFMDQMGVYFVGFVGQYGYDRVLSVLGRHMRDFLNGLDNLHEYLKFSYPRMRAPSFICENETKQGLTLHYRSKRRGFVYYTMGQIREVARYFYHKEMHIELVREEILFDTVHVTFQLTFDNRAFTLASLAMTREEKHLPISAHVLFEIFPFCIVFGADMVVRSIGNSLMVILPELLGKKITAWFDLVRPLIAFKFQTILNRTNNIFELVTVDPVADRLDAQTDDILLHDDGTEPEKSLRLKGQMVYMDNWKMIMFLGTPVMPDLTSLITTGLYINDLSMHDFSRDLMLAGTQQSVELKLALDQEQQKSKKLEESMRKLDEEMRRTDELLYQMIPKQVADRLRRGENPIDTCEMFDCVSILFSDVVTFTEICSRITPMEVVSMLNAMYSIFDTLTERNSVYKVETIGDAYMVVAGAPEKDANHAEKVCDMALDMVDAITDLKDPSTGQHLRIRVGVHSGAVVAGIVGLKMPRYCLFGDSVNTASRMESTSMAMKVHVSESTKQFLGPNYKLTERGEIDVKGKGTMKTYWLEEKQNRRSLQLSSAILQPSSSTFVTTPINKLKAIGTALTISKTAPLATNSVQINNEISNLEDTNQKSSTLPLDDRIATYEPITFNEIKRRSIAGSPIQMASAHRFEKNRESRSNSTGHVVTRSPSDAFGSLIIDTEEFLEDLQSARNSLTSNGRNIAFSPLPRFRVGSAPLKPRPSHSDDYTFEEMAAMDRLTPPSTAPPREAYPKNMLPSIALISEMEKNKTRTAESNSDLREISSNLSKQLAKESSTGDNYIFSTKLHNESEILTVDLYSQAIDRPASQDSISVHTPPPLRSLSAPLPMSKAARKAFLAAKQTKTMEKLDKMIEEVSEADSKERNLHMRLLNLEMNAEPSQQSQLEEGNIAAGGCPLLFLPPPPISNLCKAPPVPPRPQVQCTNCCGTYSVNNSSTHGRSHVAPLQYQIPNSCPYSHHNPKMSTSQSLNYVHNMTGPETHHCCSNGRHVHRMHSNTCAIL